MRPHRFPASVALVATLLLAAACGGDSNSPPPPEEEPTRTTMVPETTSGYVEARTSQIVTDGSPPSYVFDDFILDEPATIRTIGWQGIYCVQQPGAAAPSPTASSFTITLYSDAAGRPNMAAPLHTSTYTVAQAGQVYEKTVNGLTCGTAANTSWPFYRYSVELSTPFTVTAGTKYWIAIQATTPSYAVYYGWRDGRPDNGSSLQFFNGDYTEYDIDRAFSLEE